MDLAAQKQAREARMQAKREAIKAQLQQIDPSEADSVAEKQAPEALEQPKESAEKAPADPAVEAEDTKK